MASTAEIVFIEIISVLSVRWYACQLILASHVPGDRAVVSAAGDIGASRPASIILAQLFLLNCSWAHQQSFCLNLREPPAYRAEIGLVGLKRARLPSLFPRARWGLEVALHLESPEGEQCGQCCRVKSQVDLRRTAFGPMRSKRTARSTRQQLFYA